VWGGEGVTGGVDRRLKKPVTHIALRDRLVEKLGELLDGRDDPVTSLQGAGGASEVPRSGVWWAKPR
jgi:hypothetical protein